MVETEDITGVNLVWLVFNCMESDLCAVDGFCLKDTFRVGVEGGVPVGDGDTDVFGLFHQPITPKHPPLGMDDMVLFETR